MPSSPVQFSSAALDAELLARGDNRNQLAKRDLARYFRLLDRELARVNFAPSEWSLIASALVSNADEHLSGTDLVASVADAIRYEDAAERFGVDAELLLGKLAGLTPGAAAAVIDAVERRLIRRPESD